MGQKWEIKGLKRVTSQEGKESVRFCKVLPFLLSRDASNSFILYFDGMEFAQGPITIAPPGTNPSMITNDNKIFVLSLDQMKKGETVITRVDGSSITITTDGTILHFKIGVKEQKT